MSVKYPSKMENGKDMWNDSFGDLVLCPGCGTIQNTSGVCAKCGTLLPVKNKKTEKVSTKEKGKPAPKEKALPKEKSIPTGTEITPNEATPAQKKEKTKVSLLTLRKANETKSTPRRRPGGKHR